MYVAGFGENDKMQLGSGLRSYQENAPVGCAELGESVVQIGAAYFWSAALLDDGTVRTFGGNVNGELCDGTNLERDGQLITPPVSGAKQLAIAGPHAIVLLDNGRVVTWGGNAYGARGDGTPGGGQEGSSAWTPVHPEVEGAVQVDAGGANNVVLLDDGTVLVWGAANHGQAGDGAFGLERNVPVKVPGVSEVVEVSVGGLSSYSGHVLARLSNGTVMAWGSGKQGELGNGAAADTATPFLIPGLTNVVRAIAGPGRSYFILDDGSVLACGSNQYGQLGLPLSGFAAALLPRPLALQEVNEVAPGVQFTLFRCSDFELLGCGRNQNGQLGDGTANDKVDGPVALALAGESISAGEHHSFALIDAPLAGPPARAVARPGTVEAEWEAPATITQNWHLSWRPLTQPPTTMWTPLPPAAPATRSFVVPGLSSGERVELRVQNAEWRGGMPQGVVAAAL